MTTGKYDTLYYADLWRRLLDSHDLTFEILR